MKRTKTILDTSPLHLSLFSTFLYLFEFTVNYKVSDNNKGGFLGY